MYFLIKRPFWGESAVSGRNPLTISVIDKIKVINKIEVADSESDFGLHGNALVSEIFAFYLNKSDTFCYFFE